MNPVEFFTSFLVAVFVFTIARQVSKKHRGGGKRWFPSIRLPKYAETIIVGCMTMLATFAFFEDLSFVIGSDSSSGYGKSLGSKYGLVLGIAVAGLVIGHLDQKKGIESTSEDGE